ncbi:MAG: hypothetical protein AAF495_26240 [Pseudomonadota bacterium]
MSAPAISGFMVLRDGVAMGYPFVEAIVSALPVCDEFLVSDGYSSDDTLAVLERLKEIFPEKIRLHQHRWTTEPDNGRVIATVSNALLAECRGRHCLYVQGNEILHESARQEVRALPELYPEIELFKLPFLSYGGAVALTDCEFRRRLFVNTPRIALQGDAYDAGYEKWQLLKQPRRFASYLLHREGEMLCYLRDGFHRYRGVFPEPYLKKLEVRGSQYKDPHLAMIFRKIYQHAAQTLEAVRRAGQGTGAFWQEVVRMLDRERLDELQERGHAIAGLETALPTQGGAHPKIMADLFQQWRYDPWSSLARVAREKQAVS